MTPISPSIREQGKLPFHGPRVSLRPFQESDVPHVVELCVYDGFFASTEDEARSILRRIDDDCRRGESLHWAIDRTQDGAVLGAIGFYRGFANNWGEIGYVLKKSHRGQGYGTDAIALACEFGFGVAHFDAIVAYTGIDNRASRKALEKNGFVVESEGPDVKYIKL